VKVAVLGAGAIGAYVGAALHRGGSEVHLVARGAHLQALRRDGVRVKSPRGDFTAYPHATDDPREIGPVDYVFLGLKARSYASSGPLLEPLLHDRTALIAGQNGYPLVVLPQAGRAVRGTADRGRRPGRRHLCGHGDGAGDRLRGVPGDGHRVAGSHPAP